MGQEGASWCSMECVKTLKGTTKGKSKAGVAKCQGALSVARAKAEWDKKGWCDMDCGKNLNGTTRSKACVARI